MQILRRKKLLFRVSWKTGRPTKHRITQTPFSSEATKEKIKGFIYTASRSAVTVASDIMYLSLTCTLTAFFSDLQFYIRETGGLGTLKSPHKSIRKEEEEEEDGGRERRRRSVRLSLPS